MEVLDKNLYVHKFFAHELNADEEQAYQIWLSASDEHLTIHKQIEQLLGQPAIKHNVVFDKESAFQKHLAMLQSSGELTISKPVLNIIKESASHTVNPEISSSRPLWYISIRQLSALAAIMILAIGAWFVFSSEKITESFDAGKSSSIALLNDGSKVFMNQGSKLDVYTFRKTRKVALNGEAYFDVKSNKDQPFIISTGDAEIKVLGTKFTISTIDKKVKVKEGKVEVTVDGESKILTSDQEVSYSGETISEPTDSPFEDAQLWFNSELSFNNTPFDKVVDDISKFFDVKFELPQTRDWSGCTFTANSLKSVKLEDILIILQLTYELQYTKINDKTYKLSKVRCK